MLRFPDNTQVRVTGLNEILEELYSEGRQANPETAEQITDRLETRKNFIPSSHRTRKEYASLLLTEYREYVEGRGDLGIG
jgi:hypothetical protein